jgi:DNA polymerase III subunit gamma/tau
LAPELCAVSGPEREPFTKLAESMGMARLVRAMEILGRALIDMRDAPDPQVVLEIALVRTTRPDLDAGIEALTERVAALERGSSGSAAERGAPRPGTGPGPGPGPITPPVAEAPAATTAAPQGDVGRRPSVGAVRRRQETAPDVSPEQSAEMATAPAAAVPAAGVPAAAVPPVAEAVDLGPARPPAAEAAPVAVDRDALTEAWGDTILGRLSARAKALYSAGRFTAVDEAGAHFALPNAAHRDRCLDLAAQVEAALTGHFGSPIRLVLDVDGGPDAPPVAAPAPVPSGRPSGPPPVADGDYGDEADMENLRAATTTEGEQASAAEAKLLQAFPGASEVEQ